MARIYSEEDVTWSSIEKFVDYAKVVWTTLPNGIPVYKFYDENYNKIDIIIENE